MKIRSWVLVLATFAFSAFANSQLEQIQTATEAVKKGDFNTAFPIVEKLDPISNDDMEAHLKLGYLAHLSSEQIEKNTEKSLAMIEKLIQLGNLDAQSALAGLYLEGKGVERNVEKGLALLEKVAEQDSTTATLLGEIYDKGLYTRPNHQKAIYWYEKDLENGNDSAAVSLAPLYIENKQYAKALKELNRIKNFPELEAGAKYFLGEMYEKGLGVKKDLKQAFAYYKKSADSYDVDSMLKTAEFYKAGKGTAKSAKNAKIYYKKAIEMTKDDDSPEMQAIYRQAQKGLSKLN